ncbi:MAG TPA: DUF2600 family protein, partial [Limnochordales bacterium]
METNPVEGLDEAAARPLGAAQAVRPVPPARAVQAARTAAAAVGLGACMVGFCLPQASRELSRWERVAASLDDPERRRQALGSLRHKAFHSLGAAVFGALAPARYRGTVVRFAVAYQTLSDYLDNLCDRGPELSARRMRRLHGCMEQAVRPAAGLRAPGDPYLQELVACCQRACAALPGYERIQELNARTAALYAGMQARKHAPAGFRRRLLCRWFDRKLGQRFRQLCWWELAAACGSTLPVFAVFAAGAGGPEPAQVLAIWQAYFPWVASLHILLDYLIDQHEDAAARELNFASCYRAAGRAQARVGALYRRCLALACALPRPAFHRLVVAGLAAVYLSDPKAAALGSLVASLASGDRW